MNDIMSLEYIEYGKKNYLLDESVQNNLIDVASGTGDIAKFFKRFKNSPEIVFVEPNQQMIKIGK